MATAPHAILPLSKLCPQVTEWVESVRNLTQPAAVYWCEGSDSESARLTAVPYYIWNNRGPNRMAVWLSET